MFPGIYIVFINTTQDVCLVLVQYPLFKRRPAREFSQVNRYSDVAFVRICSATRFRGKYSS